MPSPYSVLALDTAGRLERELSTARAYTDELSDSLHDDARVGFLRSAIESATSTLRLLRRCVLDGIGQLPDASIDVQESALRARMNIVVRAVYFLHRCQQDAPESLFVGRFRSVADVTSYLADHITLILTQWNKQRSEGLQLDEASRRALRYASLDEAELGFDALGRNVELSRFLLAGGERGSVLFRLSCLEIAAIVGLDVTCVRADVAPAIDACEVDVPALKSACR